jgi:hypothetical protein
MNIKAMCGRIVPVLAIVCVLGAVSCAKKDSRAFVSFFAGDAMIERGAESSRLLAVGEELKNGDRIKTGDRAFVMVKIGEDINLRIGENSETVLSSIDRGSDREIFLTNGKVLSWVEKLRKGDEYRVKTSTAIAAVRGTKFLTEHSAGRSVVAVGEGKVKVTGIKKNEETLVETAHTAVVEEIIDERDISQVEQLEIKRFDTVAVIEKIEKSGEAVTDVNAKEALEIEDAINKEIEQLEKSRNLTMEEIRARYGRIDVITLYNGRVIRGAIISRGASVRVLTPAGFVTVRANEIRQTGAM